MKNCEYKDWGYGTRFAPVACTPKQLVGMLDYGDCGIMSIGLEGEKFKLTPVSTGRWRQNLAFLTSLRAFPI